MTILELLKSSTSQARPSIYGNYLSPRVQNEFLLCCEQDISILNRCNQSQFFSAMADECTDCSNQTRLSICVRYIHKDNIISDRRFLWICGTTTYRYRNHIEQFVGKSSKLGFSSDQSQMATLRWLFKNVM